MMIMNMNNLDLFLKALFDDGAIENTKKYSNPHKRDCKKRSPMSIPDFFTPYRITHSKRNGTTVVFWKDGEKTVVRPMDKDEDNIYNAFTAALAKKVFGSNSQVNKIVKMTIEPEKRKKAKKNKVTGKHEVTKEEAQELLKQLYKDAEAKEGYELLKELCEEAKENSDGTTGRSETAEK